MPQSFSRQPNIQEKYTQYDWTHTPQGVPYIYATNLRNQGFLSVLSVDYRNFSGSRVSNYRTFRSLNGYMPTTACNDTIVKITPVTVTRNQFQDLTIWINGQYKGTKRVLYATCQVTHCLQPELLGAVTPAMTNEAWSKVRRKVLDQDFNAPVFLAEAGKTVDMIYDRARSLALAYSSFRKGKFKRVAKHLGLTQDTVHNTWLEYKYGWTPLIMDIHGAAKTLAYVSAKRDIRTFSASVKTEFDVKGAGSSSGHYGKVVTEARAWVTVRMRNPSTAAANRIGLLNPLLVSWELIPFSFVADWFVNVGDCLAELTAWSGVTILTGGSSTSVTFNGTLKDLNLSGWDTPRASTAYRRNYSRVPGVQTLPRLQIKSNPLSLAKLTTAAALLRQVTR